MTDELKVWCERITNLKSVMRNDHTKTAEIALVFAKKLLPLIDDKYWFPLVVNMHQWFTFQWQIRDDHKIEFAVEGGDDTRYVVQVFEDTRFCKHLPFNTGQEQDDTLAVIVSEFLQECKLTEETKTDPNFSNALFDWIMRPPSMNQEYDDLVTNIDEFAIPLMKKLYSHHIKQLPTFGYETNGTVLIHWIRSETEELEIQINQESHGVPFRVRGKDAKGNKYNDNFNRNEMDQLVGYLTQTYADIFQ